MSSTQPLLRLLRSRATQVRSFTQTTPFLATTPKRPPPVSSFLYKPRSTVQKAAPTFIPKKASLPPAVRTEYAPPAETKIQSNAARLLGNADEILLYKGPRNIALFTCAAIAAQGIYWTATVAHGTFYDVNLPYYAKGVVVMVCLASTALASGIMLAPHHLVKSISLVRKAENQVVMRVKGTRFFPFQKHAVMDVVPGEMTVDSNVTTSLGGIRQWWRVPLKNVQSWTKGSLPRPGEPETRFERFNKRMMNIGPSIFSLTRKMFNREGMAYVRIGRENWKIDLEHCEILEGGSVLMELSQEGTVRMNLEGVISRKFFAKG
jgi:hypothetical protein